ncbi:MAG: efflux RND transporter periplasmic adaptor subunit [Pseudomonadota bacterium]
MKTSLLVIALLIAVALWRYLGGAPAVAESDAFNTLPTQIATTGGIADVVVASGVIKPQTGAEVRVGSRMSGVLARLLVDVGDEVSAGQLLAELDDSELQSTVTQLQARVLELKAQLVWSQQLLVRNQAVAAIAAVEIDTLRKEVQLNEARVMQAEAELAAAQTRLSWTHITAPIAGTVASVTTRQGETVAASFAAPTFLTILDLQRLEIHAYVDEADIGRIRAGQQVQFRVDTWPATEFTGTVTTIHPAAEIINNVVNYIAVIDFTPQPDFLLRPDMTTQVQFVLQQESHSLLIPRSALHSEGERYLVMVQNGADWQQRAVQVGIVNAGAVAITSGLNEGERYVSDYQQWLARATSAE